MIQLKLSLIPILLLSIVLSPEQSALANRYNFSFATHTAQTDLERKGTTKVQVSQETGLPSLQGEFSAYSLPTDPPKPSDTTFVVSDGAGLDFLARRENLGPTGRLDLKPIAIKRVFSPKLDEILTNGFPDSSKPFFSKLIASGVLPQYAELTLEVGDVDNKTDTTECKLPEEYLVFINGKPLVDIDTGAQAKLEGGEDMKFSLQTFKVPITQIRLPTDSAAPALQEISIEVNSKKCTKPSWEVEVNWAALTISTKIRPIVFIHSWIAGVSTFGTFQQWLLDEGIPNDAYECDSPNTLEVEFPISVCAGDPVFV